MGKLVADYLNIKNEDGVIKDLDGNILGIGGDGYQWVDETDNRDFDTTYTNDTGKPIFISVQINDGGDDRINSSLYIDDVGVTTIVNEAANSNNEHLQLTSIIPNGSTYKVSNNDGSVLIKWFELK